MVTSSKFSINFRVDANSTIGLGHLIRCIALAEMLQSEFLINFHCFTLSPELKDEIIKRNYFYHELDDEETWLADLSNQNCVVLDGYQFDYEFELTIKKTGAFLVTIDDLFTRTFASDLIINHLPSAYPGNYLARPYTLFALGLEYALLRSIFLKLSVGRSLVKDKRSIFICFGGADPQNHTQKVVEFIAAKNYFDRICVVTGASYSYKEELDELIRKICPHVESYHNLDANKMADVMSTCNIAIVPASGILLEALALRMVVITGAYIENQYYLLDAFANKGYIFNSVDFSISNIENQLSEAISSRYTGMESIIDGKSDERLRKYFRTLNIINFIGLRAAGETDLDLTYRWANDSIIRRYSFSKNLITKDAHREWFLRKIKDPECLYLLLFYNDSILGSVRFDIVEKDAIISYHIDSSFHNKGFGLPALKIGLEKLYNSSHFKRINRIVGKVQLENIASIKIFEKLGFEKMANNDTLIFYKVV